MGVHQNLTGAQRAARRRDKLRAAGLRPLEIWVPDLRDPKVRAQLRAEAAEINRRDRESGVMDYLESLSDEVMSALPDYDWGPGGPPQGDAKR